MTHASASVSSSRPLRLPASLRSPLGRVAARLRAVHALRGLGSVGLVAAIGLIVSMALDFAWPLPLWARWAIWCGGVGAMGGLAAARVLGPLVRRVGWVDLAAVAERGNPQLDERLTCAVALLDARQPPHGSPAFIAALADEAASHAGSLDLGRAIASRPASRRFTIGSLALLLVLLPAVVRPDPFATLLRRAVMPWADLERVGRLVLTVSPGDGRVERGSALQIEARVASRFGASGDLPADAWVQWVDARGQSRRIRMKPTGREAGPSRDFALSLPRIDGPSTYRVESGSMRSRAYRIATVEPTVLTDLTVRVEPPSYTRAPATTLRNPLRVDAWEGSRVTIRARLNQPATGLNVDLAGPSDKAPRALAMTPAGTSPAAEWTASLTAKDSVRFRVLSDPERRLVVRPDAPPTVAWTGRDRDESMESSPDDTLRAGVSARDDLGVASAELHYRMTRAGSNTEPEAGHIATSLSGLGSRSARGEVELGLKALGLRPGDAVSYRVRVTDNRPEEFGGPHEAWTPGRSLTIVARAEPMLARREQAERQDLQARLDAIKKAAAANRQEAEQLRYAADAVMRGNGQWDPARDQALARREAAAGDVRETLRQLAGDLARHPQFRSLARPARQVADVEAEAGRAMLGQARRAPDAARRLSDLRQADSRLAAVQTRLDELQHRFDAQARLDDDRRRLRELAERQDQLAQQANALAKDPAARGGDRAQLDRLQAEQEKLRQELEGLLKQSPALRADMLAGQAREAARLAERAHALAERQHDEARRTADLGRRRGRLKELAEAQRALEDDARRLALEVDPALAENGRGKLNTEVLSRAVEPIERGELAQARDRLEEGEHDLRRLAREIDDVREDPKTLARRLARRQEALMAPANEAIGDARDRNPQDLSPQQKTALAERLKPLVAREEAIARLSAAIPEPKDPGQAQAARQARELTARAAQSLRENRTRDFEPHLREARDALNRLADALPDPNQRLEALRQKLNEARRRSDDTGRELERHLREAGPQPGKPFDTRQAAIDLSNRLAPLAQWQNEASAFLAAMTPDLQAAPQAQAQRDRALRRVRALAEAIQATRDEAAPLQNQKPTQPIVGWQIVGPFPLKDAPPMPTDGPVDLAAHFKGRKGADVSWKAVAPADDQGTIDLGRLYSQENDQAAFGYLEYHSPATGQGQLVVGSDDTLTVWLNGKQVYQYDGNRAYSPGQARVDVPLREGPNRLLIQCGNTGGDWKFGVLVSPPTSNRFDADRQRALRESLPALQATARAAIERLDQKLNHRTPADDLAAELAEDQRELKDQVAGARPEKANAADEPEPRRDRAEQATDQRRIATALRGLHAPDAALAQDEAVRLAEQAADALEDVKRADAPEAVRRAAAAAEALARRLADRTPPRELAAALARAQRALNGPGAPAEVASKARRQRAIADELARLPVRGEQAGKARQAATEQASHASALSDHAARPGADSPPTPRALADARTRAADALDALAASLPREEPAPGQPQPRPSDQASRGEGNGPSESRAAAAPDDPELGLKPGQVAQAGQLARRERQIRERLQAILGERIPPQEQIRDASAALGRELADLRDRTRELSPRSQGPANAAAHLLGEQAPQVMAEGSQQLAQGRPDPARDAQRRAAELVEHAAQQADDLAAALRADRPTEIDAAAAEGQGHVGEAREAQREASRQLAQAREPSARAGAEAKGGQGSPTQNAARSMHQAAENLRAAAQPAGAGQPGGHNMAEAGEGEGEGEPGQDEDAQEGQGKANGPTRQHRASQGDADPHGGPAGTAQAELAQLQDLVRRKTGRTWGELPGHLRTEILQMSQGRYRDDYARLIQLYFREIAAGAEEPSRP